MHRIGNAQKVPLTLLAATESFGTPGSRSGRLTGINLTTWTLRHVREAGSTQEPEDIPADGLLILLALDAFEGSYTSLATHACSFHYTFHAMPASYIMTTRVHYHTSICSIIATNVSC